MDAMTALLTRRSTRNYLPGPVEREKLDELLAAARQAPSGGNNQTNHFFVIQNRAVLDRLIGMVEEAFSRMEVHEDTYASLKHAILASKKGGYVFCYNAPVLIVVANRRDYGNNMADCACAIENMMIAANALDLGSCWINQLKWLNEEPALVEYLRLLGIPVVTVDADDEGSGRLAFAGTNPYEAGYKAGEAMVAGTGGTAKIAVLTSGVGSGGKLDQELDGFNDAIKDYDMEVVTIEETTGDLLKATEKTQALVLAYPEVNGIYCLTTYDIQGAAKVIQENGLDNICIVGYDDGEETLNYIRSGAAYATIVQDPRMMGYMGVKLLEQINNGETLEETNIDTGTITVTKDNVDSYK